MKFTYPHYPTPCPKPAELPIEKIIKPYPNPAELPK
tara:strand:+ start:397 stop:504 length:108 start_codon:yes stop_codon:yes gene_type:complete